MSTEFICKTKMYWKFCILLLFTFYNRVSAITPDFQKKGQLVWFYALAKKVPKMTIGFEQVHHI